VDEGELSRLADREITRIGASYCQMVNGSEAIREMSGDDSLVARAGGRWFRG